VATTTLDDTRLRTATSRAVATTLREVVEHSLVDARAATRHVAAALAAGIRAMQEVGELLASLDDDQAVAALLAGIQGGVTIMLSTGQSCRSRARLRWLGSSDRPASGWPTTRRGLAHLRDADPEDDLGGAPHNPVPRCRIPARGLAPRVPLDTRRC
jgi:hypothetical protein